MSIQRILAFDTALFSCSVACYEQGGAVAVSNTLAMQRGQAEQLMPMIERVMVQAGWSYNDIDMLAVTKGPGAFTGVRIGMATAQGLAMSLAVPVAGVCTLDVMAFKFFQEHSLKPDQRLLVLIETKRKDFYYAAYDHNQKQIIKPASALSDEIVSDVGGGIIIGDAAQRFIDTLDGDAAGLYEHHSGIDVLDPLCVAKVASVLHETNSKANTLENLQPVYLRGADVSAPKKKQRKLDLSKVYSE